MHSVINGMIDSYSGCVHVNELGPKDKTGEKQEEIYNEHDSCSR